MTLKTKRMILEAKRMKIAPNFIRLLFKMIKVDPEVVRLKSNLMRNMFKGKRSGAEGGQNGIAFFLAMINLRGWFFIGKLEDFYPLNKNYTSYK